MINLDALPVIFVGRIISRMLLDDDIVHVVAVYAGLHD